MELTVRKITENKKPWDYDVGTILTSDISYISCVGKRLYTKKNTFKKFFKTINIIDNQGNKYIMSSHNFSKIKKELMKNGVSFNKEIDVEYKKFTEVKCVNWYSK